MSTHSEEPGDFSYRITRNANGLLEFNPPEHSKELRDALYFRFPSQHDYKSWIQKAILQFLGYSDTEVDKLDYSLNRNDVGDLEFTPKGGTTDLRDALHYHFPEEKDQESRIRRAIVAYHHRKATTTSLYGTLVERTDTASSEGSVRKLTREGSTSSSKAPSAHGRKLRRRNNTRRKFNAIERKQIADVRGHVCSMHKQQRTKCDPYVCEDNDLHEEYVAKRKLETERREIAHAARCLDSNSVLGNRIMIGDSNFQPYNKPNFYASHPDLHASYRNHDATSTGYLATYPANASFCSLPNARPYLPAPGEADGYYQDTLLNPPFLPSNGYQTPQDIPNIDQPVGNIINGDLNFDALPNNDVWDWQDGMRHQSTGLSSVPDGSNPRPTKSGPLVVLRKAFDRLFRTRRVVAEVWIRPQAGLRD